MSVQDWAADALSGAPTDDPFKRAFAEKIGPLFDRGVSYVRGTTIGQTFERKATEQAIKDFLSNPLVLVVGGVILLAVLRR